MAVQKQRGVFPRTVIRDLLSWRLQRFNLLPAKLWTLLHGRFSFIMCHHTYPTVHFPILNSQWLNKGEGDIYKIMPRQIYSLSPSGEGGEGSVMIARIMSLRRCFITSLSYVIHPSSPLKGLGTFTRTGVLWPPPNLSTTALKGTYQDSDWYQAWFGSSLESRLPINSWVLECIKRQFWAIVQAKVKLQDGRMLLWV